MYYLQFCEAASSSLTTGGSPRCLTDQPSHGRPEEVWLEKTRRQLCARQEIGSRLAARRLCYGAGVSCRGTIRSCANHAETTQDRHCSSAPEFCQCRILRQ